MLNIYFAPARIPNLSCEVLCQQSPAEKASAMFLQVFPSHTGDCEIF